MNCNIRYYRAPYNGVDIRHETLAAERKFLLERSGGYVHVQHAVAAYITARGIAVDDVAHDLGPQVGGTLLVDSGGETFVAEVFVDDLIA